MPKYDGCNFADNIFKTIPSKAFFVILIRISLKFVLENPIDNTSALGQIMAWCQTGDKPLPEPMFTQFTNTYINHQTLMYQQSYKYNFTNWNRMPSFWINFHHWLHRKLSFWQLPVQAVMKIYSCFPTCSLELLCDMYLWWNIWHHCVLGPRKLNILHFPGTLGVSCWQMECSGSFRWLPDVSVGKAFWDPFHKGLMSS